jgi:hypothetical protein
MRAKPAIAIAAYLGFMGHLIGVAILAFYHLSDRLPPTFLDC